MKKPSIRQALERMAHPDLLEHQRWEMLAYALIEMCDASDDIDPDYEPEEEEPKAPPKPGWWRKVWGQGS